MRRGVPKDGTKSHGYDCHELDCRPLALESSAQPPMNLILEKTKQVRFFTNMRDVFAAAGIAPQDYDWYISDIETNFTPDGFTSEDQWMRGRRTGIFSPST